MSVSAFDAAEAQADVLEVQNDIANFFLGHGARFFLGNRVRGIAGERGVAVEPEV